MREGLENGVIFIFLPHASKEYSISRRIYYHILMILFAFNYYYYYYSRRGHESLLPYLRYIIDIVLTNCLNLLWYYYTILSTIPHSTIVIYDYITKISAIISIFSEIASKNISLVHICKHVPFSWNYVVILFIRMSWPFSVSDNVDRICYR